MKWADLEWEELNEGRFCIAHSNGHEIQKGVTRISYSSDDVVYWWNITPDCNFPDWNIYGEGNSDPVMRDEQVRICAEALGVVEKPRKERP